MRVSWKWLSEMIDLSAVGGPGGLADLLTSRGLEVEEIHSQSQGFEKVVSAKLLERKPHPQADRLSLCKVSLASGISEEANESAQIVEVVCGAQNMKVGDIVALAQVGAELPNGMKIAQGKIRGEVSNGMLCSEEELGLAKASEGILLLPSNTPVGMPLAEVLGRDDVFFVLKLTANRGDCLSHFGLAREIGAALGQHPKLPGIEEFPSPDGCPIKIRLEAGEDAPQFYGIYVENVKVSPSPDWMVRKLEGLGSRSINNVVDATNLAMLELGHPMHAYDATKIQGGVIRVRNAVAGEEVPLLDGQTITLKGNELVIADANRAIGLAGVMGGGNSEVGETTTSLFLECAEFAPVRVRRAETHHQRHTDAAHRFERGVDPAGLPRAIGRLLYLVKELAGGKVKGSAHACTESRSATRLEMRHEIQVPKDYFNRFLGMSLGNDQVEQLFTRLDCLVRQESSGLKIAVPSYRLDLVIKEDLAEEVARSVGYDQIPTTVPVLSSQPTAQLADGQFLRGELIRRAQDAMVALGFMETINLSFTSQAWLSQFGITGAVKVLNPLSEEYEVMVPTLLPGLIRNAQDNWRHHFGSESLAIRLFELRPTFGAAGELKAEGELETGAEEQWKLAIVMSGARYSSGLRNEQGEVDFSELKATVERLFEELGVRGIRFQPMTSSRTGGNALFHPGQSVEILAGNSVAGHFGLIHPGKTKGLKLRGALWLAEINLDSVLKLSRTLAQPRVFGSIPEFPSMERDFALIVKSDVSAEKITQVAVKAGKPLAKVVKIFDIYRGQQVAEGMTSVAVRVIFFDVARSLQESETETASAKILDAWKKELGAELRG